MHHFYSDSIERYEQLFLETIPANKDEILELLIQEFEIQKEKMLKQWSNSIYSFGKKLGNEIIHILTGISNEKLEFTESLLEKTFPVGKQKI